MTTTDTHGSPFRQAPALSATDRLEIASLPARFCHYSDYGVYERFAELFTEDVVTELVGIGEYKGLAEQIRHARDTATWTSGHAWHVVSNLWIEPTPTGAAAHYYLLGMLRTGAEHSGSVNTTGRFVDHVIRTSVGWRIRRRVFAMDRPTVPPDLT
ncbi:nuclear transport factor 2 family protein [Yinghuangia seranimata]|uniref:nuclear transport factor 2 family protein n=1 Tax=Yinghuangia seranimata TaxID=408067 RepID=UPI00248B8BEE|nr:nuclear transport factor 2 family protein [Yinghuangia seranimata]MDI2129407.1 nuclear transport factor 2 family protein [Yinghuangia seranimata]